MFPWSSKNLPKQITSYDLLKSFAVITMIIDHVGMYLYPDQAEWRIIGRMSMPVWLFLIGYAQSRDLSPLLWIGAGILILSDIVIGDTVFSLNILVTILVARFCLDHVMALFFKDKESMLLVTLGLILLIVPTVFLSDYGTHAFLFAMMGYMVRHQDKLNISKTMIVGFMLLTVVTHTVYQNITFHFSMVEGAFNGTGILLVSALLLSFKSISYENLSVKLTPVLTWPLQFMGRYSLEIYVLHLLIIKAIAFSMFPEHFGWFNWRWL